jgi:hypothetical protein
MVNPDPPELDMGFATEDGDLIGMDALGLLVEHVEAIVELAGQ